MNPNPLLAIACAVIVFNGWIVWRLGGGWIQLRRLERQPVQVTRVVRRWDYERVRRVEHN